MDQNQDTCFPQGLSEFSTRAATDLRVAVRRLKYVNLAAPPLGYPSPNFGGYQCIRMFVANENEGRSHGKWFLALDYMR
jgi:hypothetical protein